MLLVFSPPRLTHARAIATIAPTRSLILPLQAAFVAACLDHGLHRLLFVEGKTTGAVVSMSSAFASFCDNGEDTMPRMPYGRFSPFLAHLGFPVRHRRHCRR
jgi:hypothetical protein